MILAMAAFVLSIFLNLWCRGNNCAPANYVEDSKVKVILMLVAMAILSVSVIGMATTLAWRKIAMDCRKGREAEFLEFQRLRRELSFHKETVFRLKAERDLAVRTIDSYYFASSHSSSKEVKAWMQRMYDEFAELQVDGGK